AECLLKDRRIRRYAGQRVGIDQLLEPTAPDQMPAQRIQPNALSKFMETHQWIIHYFGLSFEMQAGVNRHMGILSNTYGTGSEVVTSPHGATVRCDRRRGGPG